MESSKAVKRVTILKSRAGASHHSLFAFVNDVRMVANCWNRSGDTASSRNCIYFLEETFAILKNKTVGLFRADSGFCSEAILKFIEDKSIAYAVACKLYANLHQANKCSMSFYVP